MDINEAKTCILPGTWVFRQKRCPDGTIKKYKARYCVRGDLQEGSFDTFAPVVSWPAVRFMLIHSIINGWVTCSIDFEQAFIQSDLPTPVWIHLPRGFMSDRNKPTCLRLVKSLYGLKEAPMLWSSTVLKAFRSCGFVQSQHDQCLLLRHNCIVVLYVDDAGISAPNQQIIDTLLDDLTNKCKLSLTKEGSFEEFLGIQFTRQADGSILLTQRGLTEKTIEAAGMADCSINKTPCTQHGLGSDPEGEPMSETWNYASIVGMLLYLTTNTRPDIAFAVSQVARFTAYPRQSHAKAVKSILRYLKGTCDKGMILRPTNQLNLEAFVDADFAGLHGQEPDHLPESARSRTGYVITLGGCPVIWKSQLQSEIALSTTHAFGK